MCDKTTRCIQEVEQLFRKVSNDDLDYQTQLAKHLHIQQKIGYLKITNEQLKKSHKKELKAKDKIIQKLKDRERQLLQKLSQLPTNQRQFCQNIAKKKIKYNSTTFKDQYQREKEKQMAQKQARKKLKAQQKYQQCKGKLERLQIKYEQAQKQISALRLQNQKLTEQNYHQKLLIQAFLKQKDSQSQSQTGQTSLLDQHESQQCQSESQLNHYHHHHQQQQHQILQTSTQIMDDQRARRSDLRESKMMDLSEGRIGERGGSRRDRIDQEEQILKFIEELETDDQCGQENQRKVDQEEDDECANLSEYQSQQQHQTSKPHICSRKTSQTSIPDSIPSSISIQPPIQQPRVSRQTPTPQQQLQIQTQTSQPEQQQKLFTVKKERWFGWTVADWKWWKLW